VAADRVVFGRAFGRAVDRVVAAPLFPPLGGRTPPFWAAEAVSGATAAITASSSPGPIK
jgi:hypothetical protein